MQVLQNLIQALVTKLGLNTLVQWTTAVQVADCSLEDCTVEEAWVPTSIFCFHPNFFLHASVRCNTWLTNAYLVRRYNQ